MDYRNNAVGRDIGNWAIVNGKSKDEIAEEVKRRIETGEIAVTPYDPNRTYELHGNWELANSMATGNWPNWRVLLF